MTHTLINLNQLQQKLGGRSRSSILRDSENGTIPKPIKIGSKLYWTEAEIDDVIQKLQDERAA